MSHCAGCTRQEHDRQGLTDMLQSQVAWLGMLGELTDAVRAEDWERAKRLAARRITFPQQYPLARPHVGMADRRSRGGSGLAAATAAEPNRVSASGRAG